MTPAEIGRIVRTTRHAQGLRQDQLAGAAGVGVRFLSELERGKTTVRLEKVLAVLDTLGCRVRVEALAREGTACEVADPHPADPADGGRGRSWSSE